MPKTREDPAAAPTYDQKLLFGKLKRSRSEPIRSLYNPPHGYRDPHCVPASREA